MEGAAKSGDELSARSTIFHVIRAFPSPKQPRGMASIDSGHDR